MSKIVLEECLWTDQRATQESYLMQLRTEPNPGIYFITPETGNVSVGLSNRNTPIEKWRCIFEEAMALRTNSLVDILDLIYQRDVER
jgi:hypothetical protein